MKKGWTFIAIEFAIQKSWDNLTTMGEIVTNHQSFGSGSIEWRAAEGRWIFEYISSTGEIHIRDVPRLSCCNDYNNNKSTWYTAPFVTFMCKSLARFAMTIRKSKKTRLMLAKRSFVLINKSYCSHFPKKFGPIALRWIESDTSNCILRVCVKSL